MKLSFFFFNRSQSPAQVSTRSWSVPLPMWPVPPSLPTVQLTSSSIHCPFQGDSVLQQPHHQPDPHHHNLLHYHHPHHHNLLHHHHLQGGSLPGQPRAHDPRACPTLRLPGLLPSSTLPHHESRLQSHGGPALRRPDLRTQPFGKRQN